MPPKRWIQNTHLKKGALRLLAERENAIDADGKISLKWLHEKTRSNDPTTRKRAVLALTLRRFHNKRRHSN